MKKPAAIIKYTAISWAPSSQLDWPSLATLLAIITEAIKDTNSKGLKIILIGVNKRLKNIKTGATNNIICKLEPKAI